MNTLRMMKVIKEIVLGKKYRYHHDELGLIKRVKGFWLVEQPFGDKTIGVKFDGSDRFGPNKEALGAWLKHRESADKFWEISKNEMINEFSRDDNSWPAEETKFHLLGIFVFSAKKSKCDIVFLFDVEEDKYGFYEFSFLNAAPNGFIRKGYCRC